jgi:hypothetical protein
MNAELRWAIVSLLLISVAGAQQSGITPPTCPALIRTIADCPSPGCGGVCDAFLNLSKNRIDAPSGGVPRSINVRQLKQILQPPAWKTGNDRATLRGPEGTPVQLMGFLKLAKSEGAESCNCDLVSAADTEVHLVIVERLSDPEVSSVTAEITPRVRAAGHSDWTASHISRLERRFLRLSGWLMLDTAHLPRPVLLRGEPPRPPLKRATNWEIHPVMKLEVCTGTVAQSQAGQSWSDI